jgi:Flp pilus assembly pilin Flp
MRGGRIVIMRVWFRALRGDEHGQGLLEYALIGGVIIVGAVAVLSALSTHLNHIFATISNTLSQY